MRVDYPPAAGAYMPVLRMTTALLKDILGQSAGNVGVKWDLGVDDKGRSCVTLQLSDSVTNQKKTKRFSPEDLRNDQVRETPQRMCRDLLQGLSG